MATIASLIVDVMANTVQIQKDTEKIVGTLDSVSGMAGAVGKSLAGAFSVGAVVAYAKELAAFASDMEDAAAKTGIGVGKLQELNYAAVGAGVSVEQIAGAVSQLSKRLINGDDGAVRGVEALGLSVKSLIDMNPDEAFLVISERIAGIDNPMRQAAVAMDIFGKSGADLLPAMKEDLRGLMEQARATGAVMSDDFVAAAGAFDDALDRGVITTKAWSATVIGEVAKVAYAWSGLWTIEKVGAMAGFTGDMDATVDRLGRMSEGTNAFVREVDSLAMSKVGLQQAEKALDEQEKKRIKTREDHTRATEAAQKAADNWARMIYDLEIEAIKANQEAFETAQESLREELIASEQASQDYYAAEQQRLADSAAAYETWVQNVAEDMMAHEHDMLARTMTIGDAWRSLGEDMSSRTIALMDLIGAQLGGRFGQIVNTMTGAWSDAKTLMRSIGGIMRGDFSGLIDGMLAGIRLVATAWSALKGLFSKENEHANDTRDAFFAQFGPSGTGPDSGFGRIAALLASFEGGSSLFQALISATDVASVNAAKSAIELFLRNNNVPGFSGGTGGQYLNFGAGTPVMLHGEERVMTKAEGLAERGVRSEIAGLRADMARMVDAIGREVAYNTQIARGRGNAFA